MPFNVLVVGAGAVGCFYGSKLDPEHTRVSLVCRSNYELAKTQGFELETHSFGTYQFTPHSVYATVEEAAALASEPWDYVCVATKALSMDLSSVEFLAPVISETTTIVLLQNGVDIEAPYRERYPRTPIISAVTVISAAKTHPTRIVQYRWTRISLGPYTDLHGSATTPEARTLLNRTEDRVRDFAELLTLGGIKDVETYDALGIQLVRWHKLCINASMNTSGVLAGGRSNPDMVRDPALRKHIEACMHEVLEATPSVFGCPMPDKFASPAKLLESTARNTSQSASSMVQDWKAGHALELDAILGNAIRVAEAHGASMPRLQSMYALLQSAEAMRAMT